MKKQSSPKGKASKRQATPRASRSRSASVASESSVQTRQQRAMAEQEYSQLIGEFSAFVQRGRFPQAAIILFRASTQASFQAEDFGIPLSQKDYFRSAQAVLATAATEGTFYDEKKSDDVKDLMEAIAAYDAARQSSGAAQAGAGASRATNQPAVPALPPRTTNPTNVSTVCEFSNNAISYVPLSGLGPNTIVIDGVSFKSLTYQQIQQAFPTRLIHDTRVLWQEWQNDLKFQGFDPSYVASYLWNAKAERSAPLDIILLIVVGCERGNAVSKILKTMKSGNTKDYLQSLVTKHHIVDKLDKGAAPDVKAKQITLSRVCMAFPTFTCEFYPHVTNPTVSWAALDKAVGVEFNKFMAHASFASMIEKSITGWWKILAVHMVHQVLFAYIINRSLKKTKKDVFADCVRFSKTSVESGWVPSAERIVFLKKWGVIADDRSLSLNITNAYSGVLNYVGMTDAEMETLITTA